jgi:putative membrane protein
MPVWSVIRWIIPLAFVQTPLLLLLERLLEGFETGGIWSTAIASVFIISWLALCWPLIYRISAGLHVLVFPVASFALTGGAIFVAVNLLDRLNWITIRVTNLETALWIGIGMTAGSALVSGLFAVDDDWTYNRFVTGRLRDRYHRDEGEKTPGFVFLEVDGLSLPALRRALELGYLPNIKRWLDTGSHQVIDWEPDLSSQTSAAQAGILLGSNENIPAFRWWDKQQKRIVVSSSRRDAREIEEKLSTGNGLLAGGGASRWNMFSGDSDDCLGTFSMVGSGEGHGRTSYYAYFTNPYSLFRTLGLYVAELFREWWESLRQRITNVQPRIRRTFVFAFIRAGTTVVLPEASRFMLTADLYRGVPAVYCTYFGYDEVAHHAGVDRKDSLKVLRMFDRIAGHLERVARETRRPYHLVVLSDHGQSQGATFRQRYGKTLADTVRDLVENRAVLAPVAEDEGRGNLLLALSEVADRQDTRSSRTLMRMLERSGEAIEPLRSASPGPDVDPKDAEVVVLASGNLGLISFPEFPERMTLEQINALFPTVIPGLLAHDGIGLVMVRSEADGSLVIGRGGVYYLDQDIVAGENPLEPYGKNAARHLRRTDRFVNAPDILVISRYDRQTGEVPAFEELVGNHGGLGGPQTEPFLLYPSSLPLDRDTPIVGVEQLHRILKSWMQSEQRRAGKPVTIAQKDEAFPG